MYIYTWVCLKMGGIYPEDMAQKKNGKCRFTTATALVICYIAIEHGHRNSGFTHQKW